MSKMKDITPDDARRFGVVVKTIADDGVAAGFKKARDLMFMQFEELRSMIQPYAILKLAIEFDRHSQMAELREEKNKDKYGADVWEQYQKYLAGEVDVAPAIGVGSQRVTINGDGVKVRITDPDELPEDGADPDAMDEG